MEGGLFTGTCEGWQVFQTSLGMSLLRSCFVNGQKGKAQNVDHAGKSEEYFWIEYLLIVSPHYFMSKKRDSEYGPQ